MGEAVQILNTPVVSVFGTIALGAGQTGTINLPIPCYPYKISSVMVIPFSGLGPFDFNIKIGTTLFYDTVGNAQELFDVPVAPIPVGGFFITIAGVSTFVQGSVFDGVISLTTLPALPVPAIPYQTVEITNNNALAELYEVFIGCELVGRGFDMSPTFYPGLGPAATISSDNV